MQFKKGITLSLVCLVYMCGSGFCQKPPPDAPATISWNKKKLTIFYNGAPILIAQIDLTEVNVRNIRDVKSGIVDQVISVESKTGKPFTIEANIMSSRQGFACAADYPPAAIPIVRHSSGLSNNELNDAVYDRKYDWLLSFDIPVVPVIQVSEPDSLHQFHASLTCSKLGIRFRPRYYQQHKGLTRFEPWTYDPWPKPVVGWSSWFAYLDAVTEQNIHEAADSLSKLLLPYGYEYLQIDDGYQTLPIGKPEHWTTANNKFPSGLPALCKFLLAKGMKPAIWTNVACADSGFAFNHPDLFVKDEKGLPAYGEWIGYVMDGSQHKALNQLIKPVYNTLRKEGWRYFKVDALRHLRYEGYNTYQDYFTAGKKDREQAFRQVVQTIRQCIGRDAYLLGCWGVRPELIGLIDGCRIGNDGFSYAGLAQFNSFNNVVWRNDPDHVELTPKEAFRSCTVTSLTGSVLLLTDKPNRYSGPILEAARRTSPVLFTVPGQVYDVDPSRVQNLSRASIEVTGSGPRVFDAGYTPATQLYALDIARPFEEWMVLGRLNNGTPSLHFTDLGLNAKKTYHVFEFWTKKYLGAFSNALTFPDIDTTYNCQVFCFRQATDHPQLLATSRHISCGGLELKDCRWAGSTLAGESDVIAGEEYKIYIYVPDAYHPEKASADIEFSFSSVADHIMTLSLKPATTGTVCWDIAYSK